MFLSSPCVICLDELGDSSRVAVTPCGHFYHAECLRKWLRAPSAKRISAGVEQWLCATCKSWHNKLTPPTWSLYLEAQATSSDNAFLPSSCDNCPTCALLRQRYEETLSEKEDFAQRCEHLIAETQRQESEKSALQKQIERTEQKARRAEERVKLQNERSEELQARVDTLTTKLRAIEKRAKTLHAFEREGEREFRHALLDDKSIPLIEHTTLDSLKQCYDSMKRNMEHREEQRLRQRAEAALLELKAEVEDLKTQKPLTPRHKNHMDEKENSPTLLEASINAVTKASKRASADSRQHKHETIMPGGFSITSTTPVAKRRASAGTGSRRVLMIKRRPPAVMANAPIELE